MHLSVYSFLFLIMDEYSTLWAQQFVAPFPWNGHQAGSGLGLSYRWCVCTRVGCLPSISHCYGNLFVMPREDTQIFTAWLKGAVPPNSSGGHESSFFPDGELGQGEKVRESPQRGIHGDDCLPTDQ